MAGRRLLAAGAALVALAACSVGGAPSAAVSPSASSSSSASAAATAAPRATATPVATCRLPVASGDAPADGNPSHGSAGHGGFLTIPGGTFAADAQSLASYDLAAHKWLPVPRAWVSPDGTKYAWPEYRSVDGPATGIIHVTDVASGADHAINVPAPSMPVSYESAGVYVTRVVPNSDAPAQGLSLVDPATGALKQVIADGSWRVIAGGSAYGVDLDTGSSPPAQSGPGAGNRLRALDLATGTVRNVQTYPGAAVSVLGGDGTTLVLLVVTADRAQVRAGTATLYDQPAAQPPPAGPAVIDGTTIWLGGMNAVWRSTAGGPLLSIATPVQFASVAGACR